MAASDLASRTIVGLALIAAAVFCLWLGGVAFWVLASAAGLIMYFEWGNLARAAPHATRMGMFALSVPLAILSPWAAGPGFFALGLIAGAVFFVAIVTRSKQLAGGIVYVAAPIFALLWLREQPDGLLLAFWALALVWATDIGAYFAGRGIGGPKLAPGLSPNKTWAGLGGGVISALLLGLALWSWAGLPLTLALCSPLLAVMAQIGDLYESWLKRQAGVKDSSALLAGHGGFLDRLDGVVAAAPLAALSAFATTALS